MFDEIGDMPLHPLVTHAPVIGIPLALLLALLFAFPRTRNWAHWPLLVTVLGSTAAVFVSRESGEALEVALNIQPGNPVGDLIAEHQRLADQLFYIMLGYSVLTVVAVFLVGRRAVASGDAGTAARPRTGPLGLVLLLLVIAASVVATLWTVRVGDIGARAVWNPTGTGLLGLLGL